MRQEYYRQMLSLERCCGTGRLLAPPSPAVYSISTISEILRFVFGNSRQAAAVLSVLQKWGAVLQVSSGRPLLVGLFDLVYLFAVLALAGFSKSSPPPYPR